MTEEQKKIVEQMNRFSTNDTIGERLTYSERFALYQIVANAAQNKLRSYSSPKGDE